MSSVPGKMRWQCPGCQKTYMIPTGSTLSLCPTCTKSGVPVSAPATPIRPAPPTTQSPPTPPSPPPVSATPFSVNVAASAPPPSDPNIQNTGIDDTNLSSSQDSGQRYPNLHLNLKWIEFIAKAQLWIAIVLAIVWAFLSAIRGITIVLDNNSDGVVVGLAIMVAGPLVAFVVLVIPALLTYIALLAMVEFVRVILDIEINTRQSARLFRIFISSQAE